MQNYYISFRMIDICTIQINIFTLFTILLGGKMKKTLLIDGNSILNRAFYGLKPMTNSKGTHINAVLGFIRMINKVINEEEPDHLCVAFDVHEKTFRHKMFPEYKGTRKPAAPEFVEQIPIIQELLPKMNIKIKKQAGYEADDIIGTLSKISEENGIPTVIFSGDRDLLQLVSNNVKVRIPKTGHGGSIVEDYDPQALYERYSLTPAQVIEIKSLMGDSSDNIPGVKGIGEKTAQDLLKEFGTLDNIYANLDKVKKPRTKSLLEADKDAAYMSRALAAIDRDADIFEGASSDKILEDIAFDRSCLFTPEAFDMCSQLELKSVLKLFPADIANAAGSRPDQDLGNVSRGSGHTVTSSDDLDALLKVSEALDNTDPVSIALIADPWTYRSCRDDDRANTVTGPHFDFLEASITLKNRNSKANDGKDGQALTNYIIENNADNSAVLNTIILNMISKAGMIIVPDLKAFLHAITDRSGTLFNEDLIRKNYGKFRDMASGLYLLNPMNSDYDISYAAASLLGRTIPDKESLFGKSGLSEAYRLIHENSLMDADTVYAEDPSEKSKEKDSKKYTKPDSETVKKNFREYSENASAIPFIAYPELENKLKETRMTDLYLHVEMPVTFCLYSMETLGIKADSARLNAMSDELGKRIKDLETDIYDLAGEEFNINSPKQLGVILFEKMHLPFAKKTKTGYSTSAEVLEKLTGYDPIINKILSYRQISKLKSTYADGLQPYIKDDDRIHGTFKQFVTATGRISSADPNLQNIPVRTEEGRRFRSVFTPKEGCIFVDADYSQIELRLLAHMSGDEELIESYKEGKDIHAITASKVFHVPFEDVTREMRRNAKAVNFGIIYGISSFGLGQDLGISRKEADGYIKEYFKTYPSIKAFLDGLVSDAKDKGYSETIYGRRRPIPELSASNHMTKAFGERVAMNSPIQGSAADIIKKAMINVNKALYEQGLKARIVLQIHDELLVETPVDEASSVRAILKKEMESAADTRVPLEVDVEEGNDWNESH
jgi:DNA polymerase-1